MYSLDDIAFIHPFTCIVSGPSGSGKSFHVRNILQDAAYLIKNLDRTPKVLWIYGIWQKMYDDVIDVDIDYQASFPSEEQFKLYDLIIFDDLMNELRNDERLSKTFTKYSHHFNTSVFFVTQNMFLKSPHFRDASLSAHYFIIFKNMRDQSQIMSLARQMYPNDTNMFIEAYTDATKEKHGYIRVALIYCDEKFRLITRYTSTDVTHLANRKFSPICYVSSRVLSQSKEMPERVPNIASNQGSKDPETLPEVFS